MRVWSLKLSSLRASFLGSLGLGGISGALGVGEGVSGACAGGPPRAGVIGIPTELPT